MESKTIAILGTGSMGGAILKGLIASGIRPANINATTKSTKSAASLIESLKIQAFALEQNPDANSQAVKGAEVIVLGVKPAQILEVCKSISSSLKDGAVVISVAAGITTQAMELSLGDRVPVIRAMPNTPAVVGLGVTGISKGTSASVEDLETARALFETVGKVLVVEEEQINALSTISGSGPAYVFYFTEKLIAAALRLGFSQSEAELMVKETLLGSATLMAKSKESPETLRANVTSPNGTTMQAIARFDAADLEKVIAEATEAALARAIELGSLSS